MANTLDNKQVKYEEQLHGYKNCGYHCIVCQQIYYPEIDKWLGIESIQDAQKPITSGIFHTKCLEDYFTTYIGQNITEKEKDKIRQGLEQRIQKLTKKVL